MVSVSVGWPTTVGANIQKNPQTPKRKALNALSPKFHTSNAKPGTVSQAYTEHLAKHPAAKAEAEAATVKAEAVFPGVPTWRLMGLSK